MSRTRIKNRLARLEAQLPPPPTPQDLARRQRCAPLFKHWNELVTAAFEPMSPEEQDRASKGLEQKNKWDCPPYWLWVRHLINGLSRLPALTPPVMKDLLVSRIFYRVAGSFVCTDCGLEYPFRRWPRHRDSHLWVVTEGDAPDNQLPEFYAAYPHCGGTGTAIAGSDAVEQQDYRWKHLDGYYGPRTGCARRGSS